MTNGTSGRLRRMGAVAFLVAGLASGCPATEPEPLPPTIAELDRARADAAEQTGNGGGAVRSATDAPRAIVAFVVGERGDVLPCECPDGASGGAARRASFLRTLEAVAGPVLAVAGPGTLAPHPDLAEGRKTGEARAAWLAGLAAEAGADVIALGAGDLLELAPDALERVVDAAPVDVVMTNVALDDGRPAAGVPASVGPGGDAPRVAVLSLSDPEMALPPGYRVEDPGAAVRRALASLPQRPDAVVALWDSQRPVSAEVVAGLEGVDFVIGSSGRAGRDEVLAGAGRHLVRAAPGGTRLGLLELVMTGAPDAAFVDDRQVGHVLQQRLKALAAVARGAGDPARLDQLEEDLERASPAGHVFGVHSVALTAEVPMDEAVEADVEWFYAGDGAAR